jgi:hypothetical protein
LSIFSLHFCGGKLAWLTERIMRKQGRKFKTNHRSVPMILHREGEMLQLEIRHELAAILASKFGVMQTKHYDTLAQINNIAKVAGEFKKGSTDHFQLELESILDSMLARYHKHQSIGVNASERARLPLLLAMNDVYWKGQTTTFYNQVIAEVNAFYKERGMIQPIGELAAA